MMEPITVGVLSIFGLILIIFLGIPVAFALSIVGVAGITVLEGWGTASAYITTLPFESVFNWSFAVIPLFILMGHIAYQAGVVEKSYEAADQIMGRLPGGLAITSVIGCGAFAAVTGSSVATAAAMGKFAIPEMRKHGYDESLATGAIAAGGTFGIMIPPSIPLILYAIFAGQSVADCLMAGFLPGILTIVFYSGCISLRVKLNPELAPLKILAAPSKVRFLDTLKIWPLIFLILVVLGGIYFGIFTPTEAAAWGSAASLLLLLMSVRKRRISLFGAALLETAQTTSMIFLLIIGAYFLTKLMLLSRMPFELSQAMVTMSAPRLVKLSLIMLIYIPLGMFIDPTSILIITVPILVPIISEFGYDPVWFGIIATKMIEIGLVTPPIGLNVFVIKGIAPDIPLEQIFRGVMWFIVMDLLIIVLLVAFPGIALFLPYTMRR